LRSDDGFEDREGHQAPFTLLEEENVGALFRFLDRLDDIVKVRPVAGVEFGMEKIAIGANLEGAAA
jgi:hypothetical protein